MATSFAKARERKGIGTLVQISTSFIIGCFVGGSLNAIAPSSASASTRASTSASNCEKLQSVVTTNVTIISNPPVSVAGSSDYNNRDYGNGWHSIEVFYGNTDHFERKLDKDQLWYGQVRQDKAVYMLLGKKKNGFFVDLAANDGIEGSNSYGLETWFGWTGICIEPNPKYWSNLSYRTCQVVAAVAGKTRMEEVFFRFSGGQVGGIVAEGFDNNKDAQKDSDPRYTVTLKEIFERFNAPKVIDYLSLDVEGAEGFIMEDFPLTEYKVSIMTIERPKEPLRALLGRKGYKHLKDLSGWGETLWAHESIVDSLELSYLDTLA